MKLITLFILIICAVFMVTTIETKTCNRKHTTEEPTPITEEPATTPTPTCLYPNVIAYPNVPATIDLLKQGFGKGFEPPKRIIIIGAPTNTTDRFIINLNDDGMPGKTAKTLFHFNPRFSEKQVVRNTWSPITGWGREERSEGFPFKIGEPFILEFIAAPNNTIIITLAIRLFSVTLCLDKPIPTTTEEPSTTIQPTTTPTKPPPVCRGKIVLNNLKIPAIVDFRKLGFGRGFAPTKRIIIFGTPLAKPENFSINIGALGKLLVNADVLFHISPRFDEQQVILNSWITGRGWEREERPGGFPFKVGDPFVLEFIAAEDSIDVIFAILC
ncbi:unnamed protein product [Meloidogyne enterolobii]|uniref:Uncharacterized protein n=1 Tax=Meloidogyne enterolobii TaxID=390850 RepID=A0ACB0YVU9_MELEN